jgi:ATP-dependent exoDNAse (exonuclease V) beta subunit
MPRPLIKMIEQEIKEENDLGNPRTVMVLTSCSYMLYGIRRELRERGIPFHNPYKKMQGSWNPLSRSPTATPNRVLAYLNPQGPYMGQYQLWTAQQLQLWLELVKSNGILQKSAKKKLNEFVEQNADYDPDALLDLYMELFQAEGLEQAAQLESGWLMLHATQDKYKRMDFPMRIIQNQGKQSLERVPQVIIGTIHSTKGGQADTVYLAPDLSMRSTQDYAKGYGTEGYEAIMRQFYVGATRARERLNLLIPANTMQSVKEVFK